jgi:hypothetical protein
MGSRTFWRRTLGHAGVYLAVCGLFATAVSLLFLYDSSNAPPDTKTTLLVLLIAGLLMTAAALVCLYSSLARLNGPQFPKGLRGGLEALYIEARAISAGEIALVTIPYWLSRIALLLALFYETGSYPDYGLFLLLPFSFYCIVRSLILHYIFRERIYRNLIALPVDLIAAWMIIEVQF